MKKLISWKLHVPQNIISQIPRVLFSQRLLAIFITAAITVTSIPGISSALQAYAAEQAKIPQALGVTKSDVEPAADFKLSGKETRSDKELQNKIDQEKELVKKGKQKDLKRVKTLDEGRTEHLTIFENADGSRTAEASNTPTSYKENEQWKTIDSRLEKQGNKDEWTTKSNSWKATFKELSPETGLELSVGKQIAKLRPVTEAKNIKPKIVVLDATTQQVVYKNVWPGVDLKYIVGSDQIKETIWIKTPEAARSFEFELSGATATTDEKILVPIN